jgi:hypothetical protein
MKLLEFDEYARVAQLLWDRGLVPLSREFLFISQQAQTQTQSLDQHQQPPQSHRRRWIGRSRRRSLRGHNDEGSGSKGSNNNSSSSRRHHSDKAKHRALGVGGGRRLRDIVSSSSSSSSSSDGAEAHRTNIYGAPEWGVDMGIGVGISMAGPGGGADAAKAALGLGLGLEAAALQQRIPYNGTIFLTTEDPTVIDQANEWGRANGWGIAYTNLFDR